MKRNKSKKEDDKKLFAFLAVFLSIVGFIIALIARRSDRYIMFYAKESLVLFITWVALSIVGQTLIILSFGAMYFIVQMIWVAVIVLWIIQIINAFSGQEKSTPIIGQFAKYINL
ncbi:MAG: DUF4870 domain-containing protein [Nanoarchaeota archaeon]